MKFVSFGGITLPTTYQDEDMPINAQSNLVELQNGAFDAQGNAVTLKPAVLRYRFQADSTIDATMDALLGMMGGGAKVLKAVLRDGTTYRQTFAKLLTVNRAREPFDKYVQQVELTMAQTYPYWLATEDEPFYLDNGEILDDGLSLDGNYTSVTINSTSESVTITNGGNVPIRRGLIVLRPASGASLTNIVITNQTNWQSLEFHATLAYPQMLVLDLLPKSAKLDAVDAYADMVIPSGQIAWLTLEVGDNAIVITADSQVGNTAFEWHWSRHYL